jgi:hypothetical protein
MKTKTITDVCQLVDFNYDLDHFGNLIGEAQFMSLINNKNYIIDISKDKFKSMGYRYVYTLGVTPGKPRITHIKKIDTNIPDIYIHKYDLYKFGPPFEPPYINKEIECCMYCSTRIHKALLRCTNQKCNGILIKRLKRAILDFGLEKYIDINGTTIDNLILDQDIKHLGHILSIDDICIELLGIEKNKIDDFCATILVIQMDQYYIYNVLVSLYIEGLTPKIIKKIIDTYESSSDEFSQYLPTILTQPENLAECVDSVYTINKIVNSSQYRIEELDTLFNSKNN